MHEMHNVRNKIDIVEYNISSCKKILDRATKVR